jgi:hypothetical protein
MQRIECPVCETVLEIDRDTRLEVDHVRPVRLNHRIAILRHEHCMWKIRGKTKVAKELGITVMDIERVCEWAREGKTLPRGILQRGVLQPI